MTLNFEQDNSGIQGAIVVLRNNVNVIGTVFFELLGGTEFAAGNVDDLRIRLGVGELPGENYFEIDKHVRALCSSVINFWLLCGQLTLSREAVFVDYEAVQN